MSKPKTYAYERCLIDTDEWKEMIERRNEGGWRMVSASIPSMEYPVVAFVFWESDL